MQAKRFRVQNFRNIDDSSWIPLDRVTAFVGRNESGKTALLKALHKFNPATPEPYDLMREFPRDRYMESRHGTDRDGTSWPVCSVAFAIDADLGAQIGALLPAGTAPPAEVIATRHYDGAFSFSYAPAQAQGEPEQPRSEPGADPETRARIDALVAGKLPKLIYFENYGVLDSAIYLPGLLDDLERDPQHPRLRTINAIFRHVALDAREIAALGQDAAGAQRSQGEQPSAEVVAADRRRREDRAIRLNSASNDISARFSSWWSQRRHRIRYHADGDYFRIWVADDRRPDVEIELEARSKGFQWFFSFYLVFLVEAEAGHADAILLLDEPGLNLHPTAQRELLAFFERLAERNQLVYTTHSPFLIDSEHLHRVHPIAEDDSGHARVDAGLWPANREATLPLQAAAGHAMFRGLFRHGRHLLVPTMSDYYYLHALNEQCRAKGLASLPDDVRITPCGGVRMAGMLAAMFLGEGERPVILLDSDEAGAMRRNPLLNALQAGPQRPVVMLDEALGQAGSGLAMEDILGEDGFVAAFNAAFTKTLRPGLEDRKSGSLPEQIEATARRSGIELPDGWRETVALHLVAKWTRQGIKLPDPVLRSAARLLAALNAALSEPAPEVPAAPAEQPAP